MACLRTWSFGFESLQTSSTTQIFVPKTPWFLVSNGTKVSAAIRTAGMAGNFNLHLAYQLATTRPTGPTTPADEVDATVISSDGTYPRSGSLTAGSDMWVRLGYFINLSSQTSQGVAQVSMDLTAHQCADLIGSRTVNVPPTLVASAADSDALVTPVTQFVPYVGSPKLKAAIIGRSLVNASDIRTRLVYRLAVDRSNPGDWVFDIDSWTAPTGTDVERCTGELTPTGTAYQWIQVGLAVRRNTGGRDPWRLRRDDGYHPIMDTLKDIVRREMARSAPAMSIDPMRALLLRDLVGQVEGRRRAEQIWAREEAVAMALGTPGFLTAASRWEKAVATAGRRKASKAPRKRAATGRRRARAQGGLRDQLAAEQAVIRALDRGDPLPDLMALQQTFEAPGSRPKGDALWGRPTGQDDGSSLPEFERMELEPPPCQPDVSGPPPPDLIPGTPEWVDWWEGCVPNGPVGPGADGCDLDDVWEKALNNCCGEHFLNVLLLGLELDDNPCSYNFVSYAWVDEDCNVIDQVCGLASDADPYGWDLGLPGWPSGIVNLLGAESDDPEGQELAGSIWWALVHKITAEGLTGTSSGTGAESSDPSGSSVTDFIDDLEDAELGTFEDAFNDAGGASDEELATLYEVCFGENGVFGKEDRRTDIICAAIAAEWEVRNESGTSSPGGADTTQVKLDPFSGDGPCDSPFVNC